MGDRNIQVYSGQGGPPQQQSGDPVGQIKALMAQKAKLIQGIVPDGIDPKRLMRLALTEIQRNRNLQQCTPQSLIGSIIQCLQLGLEPDGLLGQAYIIPFKKTAQLIIGYKGMLRLINDTGKVKPVRARLVYKADEFEIEYGLNERIVHKPAFKKDDKVIGAYCIAELKDGGFIMDYMTRDEIEHVRNSGMSGNSDAWKKHWNEMARKCPIRRAFKYMPLSKRLTRAIALDETVDANIDQRNDLHLASSDDIEQLPPIEVETEVDKPDNASTESAQEPLPQPPPPDKPISKEEAIEELKAKVESVQNNTSVPETETIKFPHDFEERVTAAGGEPTETLADGSHRYTIDDRNTIIDRRTSRPIGQQQEASKPKSSKRLPKKSKHGSTPSDGELF